MTEILGGLDGIGQCLKKHHARRENLVVEQKGDNTPVSNADLEASQRVFELLGTLKENIPVLSEEQPVAWDDRKKWERYWGSNLNSTNSIAEDDVLRRVLRSDEFQRLIRQANDDDSPDSRI